MKARMRSTISLYMPPFVIMGVIFVLSHQPVLPGVTQLAGDFVLKKGAHMGIYGLLFWSWHRALITHGKQSLERYIAVFILCLLFAISDEWHQSMVAGRTGRAMDVLFDMQGMGVMFYRLRGYI
jgi:hypothetical protein